MVDLHSHSTASDGRLSPSALVELARRQGLSALALTDHDTVSGLTQAHEACRANGILFVPGIELEIENSDGEFHLLGLGLRQWATGWVEGLVELQRRRLERNHRMFAKMQDAGIRGEYDEIERLAQGGQVGRPHFARFLVERGKVETLQEAFVHFLGRGKLFYEPKAGLPLPMALEMVHDAGALAILAHPKSLYLTMPKLTQAVGLWKSLGLDGLEAWHPGALPKVARRLESMARDAGLKVSGGSDFHGDHRPDRQLGKTSGGLSLDEDFLLELFPDARGRFA